MESNTQPRIFTKFLLVLHTVIILLCISLYGDVLEASYFLSASAPPSLQSRIAELVPQTQNVAHFFQSQPTAQPQEEHPVAGADYVYNNRKWGGECPIIPFRVHVNTGQAGGANGSVEDFRDAIIAAATTWSAVAGADYTLIYDGPTDATEIGFNGVNEIVFMHQGLDQPSGLARFWFTADNIIVEADIWINDDYNWDATGNPSSNEVDLESVALHEFGHWLSLGHDTEEFAVMAPTIQMGTLKRELSENEIEAIEFIYPREEDSNCPSGPVPSPSPTPTSTPISQPTHTPTLVPTVPPTATPVPIATRSNRGWPVFLPLITNN